MRMEILRSNQFESVRIRLNQLIESVSHHSKVSEEGEIFLIEPFHKDFFLNVLLLVLRLVNILFRESEMISFFPRPVSYTHKDRIFPRTPWSVHLKALHFCHVNSFLVGRSGQIIYNLKYFNTFPLYALSHGICI